MKNILFWLLLVGTLSAQTQPSVDIQEHTITIDNTAIYVKTSGIEQRKAGQPVVVFESGLGTPLGNWDTILEEIAALAPVVAYDRPGIGKSEPDNELPTIKNVTEKLRKLLKALELEPPYILVGHSLGGIYVRGFAVYYPDELAGLVIIDPGDFTETLVNWELPLAELGLPKQKIDEIQYDRLYKPTESDNRPISIQEEQAVLKALRKTDFAEISSSTLPNIPVHILVGGRFNVPPQSQSTDYNHESYFRLRTKYWMQRWMEVVNTTDYGMLLYSSSAAHFVHRDDPHLAISSIRMVLADYEAIAKKANNSITGQN